MTIRSYFILAFAALPATLAGQFSSGSTGSDGALNLTTSGTVYLTATSFPNQCANNVCNFTTVTISANTTVVLLASNWRSASVIWLAQGAVDIEGTIHLDGMNGGNMSSVANPGVVRFPAAPGPGGFPGGVGGYLNQPAQPGAGYGGGAAGTASNPNGGSATYNYYNNLLTPLVGGAGGGGGYQSNCTAGGNGGGGGGALRIVSTSMITVNGTITSNPGSHSGPVGSCGSGGDGVGGAIHLIAPTVTGAGNLITNRQQPETNYGVTQINSSNNTFSGGIFGTYVGAGLYNPPLPTGVPAVQVVSVAGVSAPAFPAANPLVPDVTINASAPVTVAIATQNIPTTTTVTLYLTAEKGPDTTVTCGALSGTTASSTANCTSVNYPSGVTITNILAVW